MRKNKFLAYAMLFMTLGSVASCSDFEEVNTNPMATGADKLKPYYSLSASIIDAQQNPDIAERLFVINWAAYARQDGEDGYTCGSGRSFDDYNNAAFSQMSSWLTKCNTAITLCNEIDMTKVTEHESKFFPNIHQMARIWRVYLLSEFADSFGPAPLDGFQGENPTFSSVKDVYYYMLEELADAVSKLDTSVEPTSDEAKSDPAYGFNASKWKKYGISLRMRLAMRLSEADASKAKSEFEAAVAQGAGILAEDETFRVQEYNEWTAWAGVMSRIWDWQNLSATMANLTTNLGGANSVDALKTVVSDASVYENYLKDASTYVGVKLGDHFSPYSDNPTKQLWFDGLPTRVDPRALVYFYLPGDYKNRKKNGYISFPISADAPQEEICTDDNDKEVARIDATYSWNGLNNGYQYDDISVNNGLINGALGKYGYGGTTPALADEFRNSTNKRVFFGPWETYFLLAEAALRGWSVGTTAETAYYNGIKASFDYHGLSDVYAAYIDSENYNRVGTSVKWSHTEEPQATAMTYVDGYTGNEGTLTYEYPNANNILYPGKKLNDQLTKIITQLYIANTPWLPLENWSNHRRLGLPFFEIPNSVSSMVYLPAWTQNSHKNAQVTDLFVQRMKYPTSLPNADAKEYANAVSLLNGADSNLTPLWWAIGGH